MLDHCKGYRRFDRFCHSRSGTCSWHDAGNGQFDGIWLPEPLKVDRRCRREWGERNGYLDGVMPCFSPYGDRLVVSRPPKYAKRDGATGQSIWIMNSDGSEKKMIADRGAWGARWTGDGKSLVFHGGADEEGNSLPKNYLRVYDLATETFRDVFTAEESLFTKLSFHFDCSSKGSCVACGGTLKEGGRGNQI